MVLGEFLPLNIYFSDFAVLDLNFIIIFMPKIFYKNLKSGVSIKKVYFIKRYLESENQVLILLFKYSNVKDVHNIYTIFIKILMRISNYYPLCLICFVKF